MRKFLTSITAVATIAAGAAFVPVVPAQAADLVVMETQDGFCSEPKLVNRIIKRFSIQAREVHHRPDLAINAIHDIHEHRYKNGTHLLGGIDRRYCGGQAQMSDGHTRYVWFLIEYGAGFASYSDNVEFCISGLDRWNVYNSACRVLR